MHVPGMIVEGHLGGFIDGGDEGTWYPRLWDWVIQRFQIGSVLDVGCGQGHTARYFLQRGCRVQGVDGSRQAIAQTVIPSRVSLHDFCTGPYPAATGSDLVWSAEFLEHIDRCYLPNLLGTFAQARCAVLVTHALPGQQGHHHVNCQPSWYWIEWFERLGFHCSVRATVEARLLALDAGYAGKKFFAESGLVLLRTAETSQSQIDEVVNVARETQGELSSDWRRAGYRAAWAKSLAVEAAVHGSLTYRLWRIRRRHHRRLARRLASPPGKAA